MVAPAPLRKSAQDQAVPSRTRPAGRVAFPPWPCLWGPWLPGSLVPSPCHLLQSCPTPDSCLLSDAASLAGGHLVQAEPVPPPRPGHTHPRSAGDHQRWVLRQWFVARTEVAQDHLSSVTLHHLLCQGLGRPTSPSASPASSFPAFPVSASQMLSLYSSNSGHLQQDLGSLKRDILDVPVSGTDRVGLSSPEPP